MKNTKLADSVAAGVMNSGYVQIDETRIKCRDPGHDQPSQGYPNRPA
jgi:hypothetical protein